MKVMYALGYEKSSCREIEKSLLHWKTIFFALTDASVIYNRYITEKVKKITKNTENKERMEEKSDEKDFP